MSNPTDVRYTQDIRLELSTKLFQMAQRANNIRWKRELLRQGTELQKAADFEVALRQLRKLVFEADKMAEAGDCRDRAWLDGFLSAISSKGGR